MEVNSGSFIQLGQGPRFDIRGMAPLAHTAKSATPKLHAGATGPPRFEVMIEPQFDTP